VISQQQRDWQIELIQFQDLTDRLDILRRLNRHSHPAAVHVMLQNGWTLGSTQLLPRSSNDDSHFSTGRS